MEVRPTISVVVIAKNEEARLPDCLKAVHGWANEIVVVDDASTDKTVEVAKSFGAKVFSRKMDIEGRHRNWAYEKATGEWVFSVDADERVTDELKKSIDAELPKTTHTHFCMPFKTYIGDYWLQWGGWYPAPKVKLFKKSKFKYEEVEVHPRIFTEGTCGRLTGDVIHYSYRGWGDFLAKTNFQTTGEAVKWFNLSLKEPRKVQKKMNAPHAIWRMCDRFIRCYIIKKGYKDGFVGFMAAYYSAMYQIVSYAKFRELQEAHAGQTKKCCERKG